MGKLPSRVPNIHTFLNEYILYKHTLVKIIHKLSTPFLDASTHLYKRVCPSVRPERVFFNEPIMGENGRK